MWICIISPLRPVVGTICKCLEHFLFMLLWRWSYTSYQDTCTRFMLCSAVLCFSSGAHSTNDIFHRNSNSMEISFWSSRLLWSDRYGILHMARQLSCHGMCKFGSDIMPYYLSYSKTIKFQLRWKNHLWNGPLGAVSIRKTVLPGMAIPMLKIRRPNGRLIFNMEIAIRR